MEPTKQKLVASINNRLKFEISHQNPVKFLKDLDPEDLVDHTISVLYLYTRVGRSVARKTVLMTEVISAIGHNIRNKNKMKRDSALAAKAGAFLLYSFEEIDLIKVLLGRAGNGHATYVIEVLNEDKISTLWDSLSLDKTEKLPSLFPYAPWITTRHETGVMMVKTADRDVLKELTPETHPLVFNTLNKLQKVGWTINEEIYPIYAWALRNKTDAFADIWEMHNPEAKQSKIREAKAIGDIAKRFIGKTFYHLYTLDFRARVYPATAYLHNQGSDLAKGLLLRADSKPITKEGFDWLLISIASNWAGNSNIEGVKTDKIPLSDRVLWSLDNEEILISYAESPKVNQGWMKADKPWQFLAACVELSKFRYWQYQNAEHIISGVIDPYEYESHLEAYVDGSTNGQQHLAALTRDEITAPYVNLVPLDSPGDLYLYVAEHVWKAIDFDVDQLDKETLKDCENLIDTLADLKHQISEAPLKSDRRKELIKNIIKFKNDNDLLMTICSCVYWHRIKESRDRRKISKRNVMTLSYGSTAFGCGQQIIDDSRKHGIEQLFSMEHRWGAYLGKLVYEDCKFSLKRPMQLLSVFENAGKKAEENNKFLSWHVPITNFPVVQHYTEGVIKKIWIQYGPPAGERNSTGYYTNTIQLAICFIENSKPSKNKQSQGASPNAIHSLDAAHLMLAVNRSDFPITTVHDSFGCLLADMPKLFRVIRETFVELYQSDPLSSIVKDIEADISGIELGTLDITLVLDSEYAFS
jgi:DNA-directed RNA polymerase